MTYLPQYRAPHSTTWPHDTHASPWMLVRAGLTDRVIALVDEEPDLLTRRDGQGYSLVQAAASHMDRDSPAGREVVEALIERGAEVDVFTAAALNDEERLRLLLQADPARAGELLGDGSSPVDVAARAGSTATLSLLLQGGADPNPNNPLRRARGARRSREHVAGAG